MENIKKKIENFWYYHKWKVAAFTVIIITVIMAVAQCSSRPNYDYTLVLFTYSDYTDEQLERMGEYLSQYGEDLNGDGKVTVGFNNCSFDPDSTASALQKDRITRLQSTIVAEKTQHLYLTDQTTFEYLNSLFKGSELFVNLSLPEDGGKSFLLPAEFYDAAEVRGIRPTEGMRISMRIGDGTDQIRSDTLSDSLKAARDFLQKLSGTELKNQ